MKKAIKIVVAVALILTILTFPGQASGSDTGIKYPATKTTQSVSPEDDVNWTNPANIGASNNVYATAALSYNQYTYRLKAQGFDFSTIPDGATIDGILVEIERKASVVNIYDYRVQLLNASGSLVGDNKASATWYTTRDVIASYGGATDKWSASPTVAMVKDADFGVVLSVYCNNYFGGTVYVDCIRMTIYYTEAAVAKEYTYCYILGA